MYYAQFLEGKQVMILDELLNHCAYPPKIIQTSSLGRLQKKPNGTHIASVSERAMPLVRKITFKQIVEVLFQCF